MPLTRLPAVEAGEAVAIGIDRIMPRAGEIHAFPIVGIGQDVCRLERCVRGGRRRLIGSSGRDG